MPATTLSVRELALRTVFNARHQLVIDLIRKRASAS